MELTCLAIYFVYNKLLTITAYPTSTCTSE